MGHIVKQVTNYKTYKEWRHQVGVIEYLPQQKLKSEIKQNGQGHAYRRHHYQTVTIARVVVMHPVKHEMNLFTQFTRRHPVKNKTVQVVFGKSPNGDTENYHR